MHVPLATPHQSLYFDYKVYPAAAVPPVNRVLPVVVVGAGPVGLTTALLLAQAGVACVVLAAERQVCEGSRAVVFTRRSLEILQQAGASQAVTRHSLPWCFGNSFYRGQRVFRMENPHSPQDRFAALNNLQQQYVEQALLEQVARQPLVEMRWGHKVVGVRAGAVDGTAEGETAQLEVDTASGPYTQRALYVVACDGARSFIRSSLPLKLEGSSYEGRFVIADIRIQLPLPTERLAFFDPPWNPHNTVLMHRQPFDMWRVDYQLGAGESAEDALQPEALRRCINAQLEWIGHGGLPWELDWSSVYSARALTLPHYRHGRVLFAGDAAHLLPIFGVRGANTAFQDAQNLAWKLAAVVQGKAPLALLDSYSHERVAAAREIVDEAGKSTRFMTPPTAGFRLLRDAVLSLSLTQEFVRPLYHWRTSRAHTYVDSPLNAPGDDNALFSTGPSVGEPMANVQLGSDDFLMDHFGQGFLLLLLGSHAQPDIETDQVIADFRSRGFALAVQSRTHVGLAHLYGAATQGAAYLFRPDQHVCARWLKLEAGPLQRALAAATAQPVPLNPQPTAKAA